MKITVYSMTTDTDNGTTTAVFPAREDRDAAAWSFIQSCCDTEDPLEFATLRAKHEEPGDAFAELTEAVGFMDTMSLGQHEIETPDPAPIAPPVLVEAVEGFCRVFGESLHSEEEINGADAVDELTQLWPAFYAAQKYLDAPPMSEEPPPSPANSRRWLLLTESGGAPGITVHATKESATAAAWETIENIWTEDGGDGDFDNFAAFRDHHGGDVQNAWEALHDYSAGDRLYIEEFATEVEPAAAAPSDIAGNFLVRWEIDSFEDTPEQAARKAWEAIRRDDTIANCFEVIDKAGNVTGIDMGALDPVSTETADDEERELVTGDDDPDDEDRYTNYYECDCGESWSDNWSCTCNDKCPSCNAEIEPWQSFDNGTDEMIDHRE